VYETACDLEKSFIFEKRLQLKATDAFQFMYTHNAVNTISVLFRDEWELEMFQTVKATIKVTQDHWYWCRLIGHVISY